MSLATDCVTAAGAFIVVIGSSLQASGELKRYEAVAKQMGFDKAAEAARGLANAFTPLYMTFYLGPASLWPGFHSSIWRLPRNVITFYQALRKYIEATWAIGSKKKQLGVAAQIEAEELSRKALYWFLILLGTLLIFAAAVAVIILEITHPENTLPDPGKTPS